MKLMFMKTHEETVENLYSEIKDALNSGDLSVDDVESIAGLTTELAARKKEEQGGEQESH